MKHYQNICHNDTCETRICLLYRACVKIPIKFTSHLEDHGNQILELPDHICSSVSSVSYQVDQDNPTKETILNTGLYDVYRYRMDSGVR